MEIVGRDADLAAVGRFLNRLVEASGALLVEGEPGIGKTTIWREAVTLATARGFRVLAARPTEAEAALSYSVLADLVASGYGDVRESLAAPQRRALDVALLKEESDGRTDARTTAVAFLGVLELLAAETPLVVAVDDVQWADRASERALEFAMRRLPDRVGVLLARRSDGERSAPADPFERILLGPLSLASIHHLIRGNIGTVPPRPVLRRIAAASGGNPFYALELARHEGEIPGGLQDLVLARVRELTARGREALLAAAALSRPTVSALIDALGGQDEAEAAIVEAEEAGAIVTDRAQIRFSHPLLASAIYASASSERRRQLHGRLAAVVSDPEERARHLALGAIRPAEAIAADIESAADRATRRGAQDAAAELYGAAARLTPDGRPDDAARRMIGEAAALFAAGDPAWARLVAEKALARSRSATVRGEAHFLLSQIAWVERPGQTPLDQLELALAHAGEDARLRGRVHAKLVEFSLQDQPRAVEHADAAIALLDEKDDPSLLAAVLINRAFFGAQVGLGARRDLVDRALRLEEQAGADAERSRIALIWFNGMDELDAARARHSLEDEWYRDRGEEGWRAERLAHRARTELAAGDWGSAERAIEESCGTLEQLGQRVGPWAQPFFIRSLVDAHRGRIERANETLVPLIEESERTGNRFFAAISLAGLGFAAQAADDPEAADRAFRRMQGHREAIGAVELIGARTEPDHVEALLALGDVERARAVLAGLERRGRTIPRPWISVALPRVRALLLAAEGDAAAALAAVQVVDDEAAARLPFDHGRTLLVKGQLHRRLKQKRSALEALGCALELFERLGAPAWAERARSELARVGRPRRAPDGLTASELRVAELAASGLTNLQVAQLAFMSPKTVEANLSRVYRKLGIKSRAELGARMGRT